MVPGQVGEGQGRDKAWRWTVRKRGLPLPSDLLPGSLKEATAGSGFLWVGNSYLRYSLLSPLFPPWQRGSKA